MHSTPQKPIWTREYEINTYLVTPRRMLGLFGLLNLIQDTAWVHATHLGHGYEAMVQSGLIWVLTRQKVDMTRWPKWGEKLEIKTWVRPLEGIFANRDFEFRVGGEKIGECATSWLTMDLKTRKARRIDPKELSFECRTDYKLDFDAPKIQPEKDLKSIAEFQVRNSDLDLNDHVNNTKYAQWIVDSISRESREQYRLHGYEVNFLAETKLGDAISIQIGDINQASSAEHWIQFQGRRENDQTTAFVARLCVSRSVAFW